MNRSRKNRHSYAALTLACSLALAGGSVLTGCSSASTSASKVTTESSDESSTETSAAVSSANENSSAGETAASGSGSTAESGESGSAAENSGNAPSGQAPGNGQAPANGETPPELPSGESGSAPSGQAPRNGQAPANGETPPEKPSGDTSGNTSGQAADGSSTSSDQAASGQTPGNGQAPGGGADTANYDYTGELSGTLTADGKEVTSDGETTDSSDADVNTALSENGGTLKITNGTLTKSGDDTNGDNCNFYGLNSVLLSSGEKSKTYISDSSLSADSEGANGIFATDSGTAYANNVKISTTAGNSRGLDATYGGTIIANNMDISTKGDHSASLATDRGGGSVSVTNSTLNTAGSGSPLIYSTGDIEVDNVTGMASGSQIAGMEGLNTILINNSNLTSTITDKTASDPVANGIILYQSTSGDAEATTGETATFQATNSTLKSAVTSGAMFYVTNTQANVYLSGTTLDFDSDKVNLMTIAGNNDNNWGTAGSNGGTVTFTADGETLSGNISVDTISSLDFYLLNGTTYTGAMEITDNAKASDKSAAPITVNVSSDSTWVVTADTTITNLNEEDGAKIVDADGKTVTIVADGEKVVEGDSDYTVTVSGTYSTTVTTDEDNEAVTSDDTKAEAIDRSDFDAYYSTSTTYGTNQS